MNSRTLLKWNDHWLDRMQFHSGTAIKASMEWERRKPEITAWLKERPGNDTDFKLRQSLKDNWTLNDLMDKWSWHERVAKLYSADLVGLNAYLSNRVLLLPGGVLHEVPDQTQ
jgi:hypothetical protein